MLYDKYKAAPLDLEELQRWKDLVTRGYVDGVLGEILREADERKKQLFTTDFTTPEGVNEALNTQGIVRGLERAFDLLMEVAERCP